MLETLATRLQAETYCLYQGLFAAAAVAGTAEVGCFQKVSRYHYLYCYRC